MHHILYSLWQCVHIPSHTEDCLSRRQPIDIFCACIWQLHHMSLSYQAISSPITVTAYDSITFTISLFNHILPAMGIDKALSAIIKCLIAYTFSVCPFSQRVSYLRARGVQLAIIYRADVDCWRPKTIWWNSVILPPLFDRCYCNSTGSEPKLCWWYWWIRISLAKSDNKKYIKSPRKGIKPKTYNSINDFRKLYSSLVCKEFFILFFLKIV